MRCPGPPLQDKPWGPRTPRLYLSPSLQGPHPTSAFCLICTGLGIWLPPSGQRPSFGGPSSGNETPGQTGHAPDRLLALWTRRPLLLPLGALHPQKHSECSPQPSAQIAVYVKQAEEFSAASVSSLLARRHPNPPAWGLGWGFAPVRKGRETHLRVLTTATGTAPTTAPTREPRMTGPTRTCPSLSFSAGAHPGPPSHGQRLGIRSQPREGNRPKEEIGNG